jgi:hypothetical protein
MHDGNIEFDEGDIIHEVNSNMLELGKIQFNIGSVVYEKANASEIIDGFEELSTYFDFVRVFELLSIPMIAKINNMVDPSSAEPDTVDFLKICYWYNRLKYIDTIKHRRKEILSRLCQRLLHRLEKRSKRTIDYSVLSDNEIKKKIENTLKQIRRSQAIHDNTQIFRWLNEYLNFVNVCISELIFPSLASELGFKIDFVPRNKERDYDYDIVINGHFVQIKTLFSYEAFAIDETERRKQIEYRQGVDSVRELYYSNQITTELVQRDIISFIKSNCIDKITKALTQKAEIIIIDGTRTVPGFLHLSC